MPRRARLAIARIPWHIIQRGNNRSACFFAEEDYLFYLDQLRCQSAKFGCAIHAYCLMTNHVHLLLTPSEADETERQKRYRSLLESEISDQMMTQIRSATNSNYVLGSNKFQNEIELTLNRRTTPSKPGRPRKIK